MLQKLIKNKIDIYLASKTELDSSFPDKQYIFQGYSTPFRLDRNGGGLLLYVCENIPCKTLNKYTFEKPIGNIYAEINLTLKKWLLSCSYNTSTYLIADHLHCNSRGVDFYSSKYDNFIGLGD